MYHEHGDTPDPPLVPDMLLSLGVEIPQDVWSKSHRAYFVWEFGKPPDVVVELGIYLWEGRYEGLSAHWLRWCGPRGELVETGAEWADQEQQRAERMTRRLRALGIDPDELSG